MPTYTALINPVAGGGHALRVWRPVADLLASRGVEVSEVRTRSAQHSIDTAADRAQRGETVIAVGGDGLVRDVAAGVFGSGSAMAIVPAGRGNDLARKLDLPTTTGALAAMLETGGTRRVDVIEAAGQVVLGNVYVGIDSVATEAINNTRWLPGRLVYRLAPVGAILRWQPPEFRLSTPEWSLKRTLHQVVVANSGRYGYGLNIVPSARMDDGTLDVLTVGNAPKRKVVRFINRAKTGRHVDSEEVEVRTTTEITLDADSAVPVHADGDYLADLPVTIRLRPAALDLVVP
ncbi:diacylglycerol kinase family lipid kinase [Allosaccharopolyspora coralli]|uniref:Diacylglycerol kinase family lipid kinase n=1 Tax=Allosaccharopolyspora coralli TaxID=2665642 RepID=A0A5Q3QBV2_9PSEU|nr:diacylglycerol kinase family protein [Allosaccharopolyspora coralli]QGK71350.1 diacylglycerol kinase family lipid kinase [Allosaccharopolyspora coralli]